MEAAHKKPLGKPKGGGGSGESKGGGGSGSNKGGNSGKKGVGTKGKGTGSGEERMLSSSSSTLAVGSGKGSGEGKKREEEGRVVVGMDQIGKKVGRLVGELTGVAYGKGKDEDWDVTRMKSMVELWLGKLEEVTGLLTKEGMESKEREGRLEKDIVCWKQRYEEVLGDKKKMKTQYDTVIVKWAARVKEMDDRVEELEEACGKWERRDRRRKEMALKEVVALTPSQASGPSVGGGGDGCASTVSGASLDDAGERGPGGKGRFGVSLGDFCEQGARSPWRGP